MKTLGRGANVALTKEVPSLKKATVGVRWLGKDSTISKEALFGAVITDSNEKAISDDSFIFFNHPKDEDSILYLGENSLEVTVDLERFPTEAEQAHFVVWLNNPQRSLTQFKEITATVKDSTTGASITSSENLITGITNEKALVLAQLYKHNGLWKFKVRGEGWSNGVTGLISTYGLGGK